MLCNYEQWFTNQHYHLDGEWPISSLCVQGNAHFTGQKWCESLAICFSYRRMGEGRGGGMVQKPQFHYKDIDSLRYQYHRADMFRKFFIWPVPIYCSIPCVTSIFLYTELSLYFANMATLCEFLAISWLLLLPTWAAGTLNLNYFLATLPVLMLACQFLPEWQIFKSLLPK